MAVTGTLTNREICNQALRKIGVVAIDDSATAEEVEAARVGLRRMLKSWQNREILRPQLASQSVTLTTAASYTLNPVRPLSIYSCRFKRSGLEIPMQSMTRDEYDTLPSKTTTGTPTQYHYSRQKEAALLYVWPVLSMAAGETLEITYVREFEDVVLDDAADIPGEMEEAVVYGLAARLTDDFKINAPNVIARAEAELKEALAFDREESVYFAGYPGD